MSRQKKQHATRKRAAGDRASNAIASLWDAAGLPPDILGRRFNYRRDSDMFTVTGTITGCTIPDRNTLILHTSTGGSGKEAYALRYSRHHGKWTYARMGSPTDGDCTAKGEREHYLRVYGSGTLTIPRHSRA